MADVYTLGTVGGITKTELWNGDITSNGTYTLNDSVNNYKMLVVEHCLLSGGVKYWQSLTITSIYTGSNNVYIACHGNGTQVDHALFYFSTDGLNIVCNKVQGEYVSKIYGIN